MTDRREPYGEAHLDMIATGHAEPEPDRYYVRPGVRMTSSLRHVIEQSEKARLDRAREVLEDAGYKVRTPGEPDCRECQDGGGYWISSDFETVLAQECEGCGKTAVL